MHGLDNLGREEIAYCIPLLSFGSHPLEPSLTNLDCKSRPTMTSPPFVLGIDTLPHYLTYTSLVAINTVCLSLRITHLCVWIRLGFGLDAVSWVSPMHLCLALVSC